MSDSNNPYEAVPFHHLCDARPGTDKHQDQLLALWEKQPKTEDDAKVILRTLHHRHERSRRNDKKRAMQLTVDVAAPEPIEKGQIEDLLESLSGKDQQILNDHVLNGLSFADVAKKEHISKSGAVKRFKTAKKHLIKKAPKKISSKVPK